MLEDQGAPQVLSRPKFSIKAAARMVGVSPATLRARERRYALPGPVRSPTGYRLYSDQDLAALRWVKEQAEAGIPVGEAARHLVELRRLGRKAESQAPPEAVGGTAWLQEAASPVSQALRGLDSRGAEEALGGAYGAHPALKVLARVVPGVMRDLGSRWEHNEIPVAVEHFATQFFLPQMMSQLERMRVPRGARRLLAACAPGEFHELGLLVLVALRADRGWDMCYLGPNLKLNLLDEALRPRQPATFALFFSRRECWRLGDGGPGSAQPPESGRPPDPWASSRPFCG